MWNAVWDGRPAEYSAMRDCWLTRRRALFIEGFLSSARAGARVLELGSGTGNLLILLARARPDLHFTGIEPQSSYVEFAADAALSEGVRNLSFRVAQAEHVGTLFEGEAPFDRILSNDLLHHVAAYPPVLDALGGVARSGTRWLAIEPNWRNPYVLIGAAIRRGERNFWPRPFLADSRRAGWLCLESSFLFLLPPGIRRAPPWAVRLERAFEGNPVLAGGAALSLELG